MNNICCFAGHSKIYYTDNIFERLTAAIENLIIKENVSEFWVGNYGNFDKLSAKAVRSLKNKYPVRLNLVIPYLTLDITESRELYYKNYDSIIIADMPENTPKRLQIIKCNQYMVQSSQFLICYILYNCSGAAQTLEYAQRKKKNIIRIENS